MKVAILLILLCAPTFADAAAGQQAMKDGDYATAYKEFLPLAKQGNAAAQLYLGFLYGHGQGVKRDFEQAATWYRSAASLGLPIAQVYLGTKYEYGSEGFPLDYKEAVKWYRLAAEQGNASAQDLLGYMYFEGLGVPQDYVQAHMWFNLASAGGSDKSIKSRDMVAAMMNPDQIGEAQRMAREWKPKANQVQGK